MQVALYAVMCLAVGAKLDALVFGRSPSWAVLGISAGPWLWASTLVELCLAALLLTRRGNVAALGIAALSVLFAAFLLLFQSSFAGEACGCLGSIEVPLDSHLLLLGGLFLLSLGVATSLAGRRPHVGG